MARISQYSLFFNFLTTYKKSLVTDASVIFQVPLHGSRFGQELDSRNSRCGKRLNMDQAKFQPLKKRLAQSSSRRNHAVTMSFRYVI